MKRCWSRVDTGGGACVINIKIKIVENVENDPVKTYSLFFFLFPEPVTPPVLSIPSHARGPQPRDPRRSW